MNSLAQARQRARHLTFDSIDGPPPQVFERFVEALNAEAQAKALPIVSREGTATYRVRAYLAAQISRGRTTIAWTFDIYEAGQQRALRLTGEEPAGKPGRDAWTVADAQLLRRIAQNGMAGVAELMNGTRPSEPPAQAPPRADRPWRTPWTAPAAGRLARRLPSAASKFFVHHQNGLILRRKTRLRHIASGSPSLISRWRNCAEIRESGLCRGASQDRHAEQCIHRFAGQDSDVSEERRHQVGRGQLQSRARQRHRRASANSAEQGDRPPLRGHGDLRRDPGKRPRLRRVRGPVDVVSRQRPPDGAADHHRRAAARFGAAHHGGASPISATRGRTAKSARARRSRQSSSPT